MFQKMPIGSKMSEWYLYTIKDKTKKGKNWKNLKHLYKKKVNEERKNFNKIETVIEKIAEINGNTSFTLLGTSETDIWKLMNV